MGAGRGTVLNRLGAAAATLRRQPLPACPLDAPPPPGGPSPMSNVSKGSPTEYRSQCSFMVATR
jgi:hypothetical protein